MIELMKIVLIVALFNRTQQNTFTEAKCEAKCYTLNPIHIELIEPFIWNCETNECSQCLKPLKDLDENSKYEFGVNKEECIAKCGNEIYCQQSCECKYNVTAFESRNINNNILTRPTMLCSDQNDQVSVTVYLEWIMQKSSPAVYVLQLKEKRRKFISQWITVGKGVYNAVPVNLHFAYTYKFLVTAVFANGSTVVSQESGWIGLNNKTNILPPTNIVVSNMSLASNNRSVNAILTWDEVPGKPCLYKVFWQPESWYGKDGQKEIDLLKELPIVALKNLPFTTNYTIAIMSATKEGTESEKQVFRFTTYSCLRLHNNNFTNCGPPPPRNLQIVIANSIVHISWKKPLYTSSDNRITEYSLKVEKVLDVSQGAAFKFLQKTINVPENKTSVTFNDLDPGSNYNVFLYASSVGGNSTVLTSHFAIKAKDDDKVGAFNANSGGSWIAIGLSIIFMFIILTFAYFFYCKKKKYNEKRNKHFQNLENHPNDANENYISTRKEIMSRFDDFEVDFSAFQFQEEIGQGAFGVVLKARYKDKTIAVKMVKDNASDEDQFQLVQEIEILKNVGQHPHVVGLIACCTRGSRICLAVEYCPLGDLQTYLRQLREKLLDAQETSRTHGDSGLGANIPDNGLKYAELIHNYKPGFNSYENVPSYINILDRQRVDDNREKVTPVELISYARQIAIGMEYLATNKFVHRDLAARNILMASKSIVKISDFGLTRDIYERNIYQKLTTGKLPIKWMALESILDQIYTTKSDVWSFGIVLWEITTLGGMPYPRLGSSQLIECLKQDYRMEKPDNCSEEMYHLMRSCWQRSPKSRPTFTELKTKLEEMLECTRQYMNFDLQQHKDIYIGLCQSPTNDSAFVGSRDFDIKTEDQDFSLGSSRSVSSLLTN